MMTVRPFPFLVAGLTGLCLLMAGLWAGEADPLLALATFAPEQGAAVPNAVDAELRALGPAKAAEAEGRLLAALARAEITEYGYVEICRRLARVGSAACVPALAKGLGDAKRSQAARMVLQNLPAPEAAAALRSALDATAGELRIGIIGTLGRRGDAQAIPALTRLASDADGATAAAAITALGHIAAGPTLPALTAMKPAAPALAAWTAALLEAAERSVAAKDAAAAREAYQLLMKSDKTPARVAGLAGLAALDGERMAPALVTQLTGADLPFAAVARRMLVRIPGEEATRAVATALPAMTPVQQVVGLEILAARGDAAGAEACAAATASSDAAVKAAAITALGTVGNQSHADLLLAACDSLEATVKQAARAAFAVLRPVEAVNQALLGKAGRETDTARRGLLLGILVDRNCRQAVPVLMADAKAADQDRRSVALKLLGELAVAEDAPALLTMLVASKGDEALERALINVLRRSMPDPSLVAQIIAACGTATGPARCSLLRLFPSCNANQELLKAMAKDHQSSEEQTRIGLDQIRASLGDAQSAETAIRVLSDWPSATVAGDLVAVAGTAPTPALRTVALRGLVRVLDCPDQPGDERSVELLEKAFGAHPAVAERKLLLGALGNHPSDRSLALVEGLLSDAEVKNEAVLGLLQMCEDPGRIRQDRLRAVLVAAKEVADDRHKAEIQRFLDMKRIEGKKRRR